MPRLRSASAREVLRVLNSYGFRIIRQSGSHIQLIGKDNITAVTVPNHAEISKDTISWIIKQSGIAKETFLKLL